MGLSMKRRKKTEHSHLGKTQKENNKKKFK